MAPRRSHRVVSSFVAVLFILCSTAYAQGLVVPGDANDDGAVNAADVLHLVNSLFGAGGQPAGGGDANGDARISVADIFYLINHLFASGPAPLAPQPPGPTSFKLIDEALASGSISPEVALTYKVYTIFDDPRLPAQFRGDDRYVIDTLYMAEVAERFPSLSPETKAIIRPFLIPPFHGGSWWDLQRSQSKTSLSGSPRASACPPDQPGCLLLEDWDFVATLNGKVKVWYLKDQIADRNKANDFAFAIDNVIWPKLSAEMTGHQPLPDDNALDPLTLALTPGGDGRLDIVLVDVLEHRGVTVPYAPLLGCSSRALPVYINVKQKTRQILVHELMHAFQFSYNVEGEGCHAPEYNWLSDATANWAMDDVYRNDQEEHGYTSEFLEQMYRPLETDDGSFRYGAYLYFFFLTRIQKLSGIVGTTWANTESMDSLAAIEDATSAANGGFLQLWPKFALRNWNREPVNDYFKEDRLIAGAAPIDQDSFGTSMTTGVEALIPANLSHLSAHHFFYGFHGPATMGNARSVAFLNGATFQLSSDGQNYSLTPVPAASRERIAVQALIRPTFDAPWQQPQPWVDRPFVLFCNDDPWRPIHELALTLSNSEFQNRETPFSPAGLQPMILVSNIACHTWKGEARFTSSGFGGNTTYGNVPIKITYRFTLTRDNDTSSPSGFRFTAQGTADAVLSGTDQFGCTYSGSDTVSVTGWLETYNFAPAGSPGRRRFLMYLDSPESPIESRITYSTSCPGLAPYQSHHRAPWRQTSLLPIEADGVRMAGQRGPVYISEMSSTGTWEWNICIESEDCKLDP